VSAVALVSALGMALTACGGSSGDPDDAGALGSPSSTPTLPTATPTKHVTKTKTPKPKPSPTATPDDGADGGDGDSVDDDTPVTAGGGICSRISAADVGEVIGSGVTGTGISGGCVFSHADHRAVVATVKDEPYAGMDAAKAEATSAVEGDPENLSGVGRGAFVVTGTIFGGTDINGGGAVHVGSRTLSVLVVQSKGLPRTKVRTMVVELLQLMAREAG
jgi:hypothetical protein